MLLGNFFFSISDNEKTDNECTADFEKSSGGREYSGSTQTNSDRNDTRRLKGTHSFFFREYKFIFVVE